MSTTKETLERLEKSFTEEVAQNIYNLLTPNEMSGRTTSETVNKLIDIDGEEFKEASEQDDELDNIDSYNRIPSDRARRAVLYFIEELLGFSEMLIDKETTITHKIDLDDEESDKSNKDETLIARYYYLASSKGELVYRLVITHTFLRIEGRSKRPNMKKTKSTKKPAYQAYWLPIRVKSINLDGGKKKYVLSKYPITKVRVQADGTVLTDKPNQASMNEWKSSYQIGKQNLIELAHNLKSACAQGLNTTRELPKALFESWLFQLFIVSEKLIYNDIGVNILDTSRDGRRRPTTYEEDSEDIESGQESTKKQIGEGENAERQKRLEQQTQKAEEKTKAKKTEKTAEVAKEIKTLEDLRKKSKKTGDELILLSLAQDANSQISYFNQTLPDFDEKFKTFMSDNKGNLTELTKKKRAYSDSLSKIETMETKLQAHRSNPLLSADTEINKTIKALIDEVLPRIAEKKQKVTSAITQITDAASKLTSEKQTSEEKAEIAKLNSAVTEKISAADKKLNKLRGNIDSVSDETTLDTKKADVERQKEDFVALVLKTAIKGFENGSQKNSAHVKEAIKGCNEAYDALIEKFNSTISSYVETQREKIKQGLIGSADQTAFVPKELNNEISNFPWFEIGESRDSDVNGVIRLFNEYASRVFDTISTLNENKLKTSISDQNKSLDLKTDQKFGYLYLSNNGLSFKNTQVGYNDLLTPTDVTATLDYIKTTVMKQAFYQIRAMYYIILALTNLKTSPLKLVSERNNYGSYNSNDALKPKMDDNQSFTPGSNHLAFRIDFSDEYQRNVKFMLDVVYFEDKREDMEYELNEIIRTDYDKILSTDLKVKIGSGLNINSLWLSPGSHCMFNMEIDRPNIGTRKYKFYCYCTFVGEIYVIVTTDTDASFDLGSYPSFGDYFKARTMKDGETMILFRLQLTSKDEQNNKSYILDAFFENIRSKKHLLEPNAEPKKTSEIPKRRARDIITNYQDIFIMLKNSAVFLRKLSDLLLGNDAKSSSDDKYNGRDVDSLLLFSDEFLNLMTVPSENHVMKDIITTQEILVIMRLVFSKYNETQNKFMPETFR